MGDARSRFESKRYNSAGVDWSGRLDSKRRAYRSGARSRVLDDGTEELGDLSDEEADEDAEGLERKIARLRREVEEAKEEYARKQAEGGSKDEADKEVDEEGLASLGQALEEISRPPGVGRATRTGKYVAPSEDTEGGTILSDATYTVTYAPTYEQSHALAKAAEFEQRLLALEKSVGVGAATSLELGLNGLPRAILPTMDSMHQQISALGKASTTSLDAISRRVRTITADIDGMNKRKAQAQHEGARYDAQGEPQARAEGEADEGQDDQAAKINALYGTLPTIEALAPLLQPLLDRLRSLRVMHGDAAAASETLDRIERQQVETAAELKQWREGLGKISTAMGEGREAMEGNMGVMEGWVRDLEARMEKLST